MISNYEDALTYIHSLPRFSGKPSLERIRKLLNALGNPQKNLKFVHIAGTNGKGSTAVMTSEVLKQAGYKTGLFISPYILDFRERIQINGEYISKEILTTLTNMASSAVKSTHFTDGETIGEFEFITAIALKYFEIFSCDIVVLEVGIGGRFDATNIIEKNEVCAITSISFDHTAILGDTLSKIATEKCGIIKNNSTVILYPCQDKSVLETVKENCLQKKSKLIIPNIEHLEVLNASILGTTVKYRNNTISIPLIGKHQAFNTLVVLEIIFALRDKGFNITDNAVICGISKVHFPGRMEIKSEKPLIIFDGAHNEGGVSALCNTIDTYLNGKIIYMILGMVSDKDYKKCIEELSKRAYMIFAVEPDNIRALDSKTLTELASTSCASVYNEQNINSAMQKALEFATDKDVVLVCGSLYLVSDAEKSFCARHEMS